jgi:predicted nicotinamide N-methyase
VDVAGVASLQIRSLLDRQQFHDPLGVAAALGISSATWPLFGLLWPSGLQLAARLAARPVQAGERILEIGCGLALASLVGHRRGADITASDCHPLAARFLRVNARLNALTALPYRHGRWGAADDASALPGQPPVEGLFDLLIGSDLLYERDQPAGLAGFIARHAAPSAEVWIVDPNRGNRPAFHRQMAERGFSLSEERIEQAPWRGRLLTYRRAGM